MKLLLVISLLIATTFSGSPQSGLQSPAYVAQLQNSGGSWSSNDTRLWLVADDLSGVANNTAPLLWTNRMAGSESFTNALPLGPIKSNSVVNGHAAIWLDGSDDFFQTEYPTNWNSFVGAEDATIFMVVRKSSLSDTTGILQWISGAEQVQLYASYADTFYFDFPNSGGTGRISGAEPGGWDNAWHILEAYRANDVSEVLVDGVTVISGTPSANFTPGGLDTWKIGVAVTSFFAGNIAEVIIDNTANTSGERLLKRQYLQAKYGTPALP